MDVARDPLFKKSIPPFLNKKLPAEPRLDCVDYGTSSLALDSASQCPTRSKEDGKDEVPSKPVVKDVNNKSCKMNSESKKSRGDQKSESKNSHNDKKSESQKSRDDKKSEDKKSPNEKKFESKVIRRLIL